METARTQQPDEEKLRELVLHIAQHSEGDRHFGATKLNKLLFFSDFLAYRLLGSSITGSEYQKLEHGPAPRRLKLLLKEWQDEGAIAEQRTDAWGYPQIRTVALRDPILERFSAQEIALVDRVIAACRRSNAKTMSDGSHQFVGWQLARMGETIPYPVALVGKDEPTEEEREYGLSLEEEARACLAR